jgi:hypothetical protein
VVAARHRCDGCQDVPSLQDTTRTPIGSPPPSHPSTAPGVTALTTHLQPDAAPNNEKARALVSVLPHLASLHVHFGARCSGPAVGTFLRGVRGMGRLRDLRVTSWVPHAPQKGAWPDGCFAGLQLGGVTRLVVDGAPLSEGEALVRAPGTPGAPGGRGPMRHAGGSPLARARGEQGPDACLPSGDRPNSPGACAPRGLLPLLHAVLAWPAPRALATPAPPDNRSPRRRPSSTARPPATRSRR